MRIKLDSGALREAFYADCSDRDVEVSLNNLTEVNPMAPFTWTSEITSSRFGRVRRTYIETLQDRALPLQMQRRFQIEVPGATVATMNAAHSPFFSQPEPLADLIDNTLSKA